MVIYQYPVWVVAVSNLPTLGSDFCLMTSTVQYIHLDESKFLDSSQIIKGQL